MTVLKQLYELQEIDLEILSVEHSLPAIQKRLSESPAITKLEARLGLMENALKEASGQRRNLEREAQELREKLSSIESKLFSGGVTRERELEALQQEQNFIKRQLSEYEDKLLEVMMAVDNGTATRDKLASELVKLKSERELETASLHAEQTELHRKIKELSKDRTEVAANITQTNLAQYDSIRKKRGGQPVAKVVGGICQGCRVRLPSGEAQRAKSSGDLVRCSSCRRILYVV